MEITLFVMWATQDPPKPRFSYIKHNVNPAARYDGRFKNSLIIKAPFPLVKQLKSKCINPNIKAVKI